MKRFLLKIYQCEVQEELPADVVLSGGVVGILSGLQRVGVLQEDIEGKVGVVTVVGVHPNLSRIISFISESKVM